MKHFGREFQQVVEESALTVTELAARVGMQRRNIYKIYERETVDLSLAIKLGEILQHDFLVGYLQPSNLKLLKYAQKGAKNGLFTSKSGSFTSKLRLSN
jgi:DNA-binding XRE family transcriptional regulator